MKQLMHPTTAASLRQGGLSLRGGAAALCLCATVAQATARAVPVQGEADARRTDTEAIVPIQIKPDNPALEQTLKALRSTAQAEARAPEKKRPSPKAPADSSLPPAEAAWLLGLLALHGIGMPSDAAQAQQWFDRALQLGHRLAPAGLAWCAITGCVSAPDPAAARPWIAKLANVAPGLAQYLEWHADKAAAPLPAQADYRTEAPLSSNAQLALLTSAARAGNASAMNELGLEYLSIGDLNKAMVQFQAAALQSKAAAANAGLLRSRIHRSTSLPGVATRFSAHEWYVEAQRYHKGDGVPANYAEAIRLYQIAASNHNGPARRMLELIFSRPAPNGAVDPAWMQQLAALELGASGQVGILNPPISTQTWQHDPSPLFSLLPQQWQQQGPR